MPTATTPRFADARWRLRSERVTMRRFLEPWEMHRQHLQQCFVKTGARGVLAHHPGVCIAYFFNRIVGEPHQVGIPLPNIGIACRLFRVCSVRRSHALTHLHQGMLDMARLLVVVQILGDCWSERWRPNHVFHQNRNGMRTISQPVAKNRIFWVRDILRLGLASGSVELMELGADDSG